MGAADTVRNKDLRLPTFVDFAGLLEDGDHPLARRQMEDGWHPLFFAPHLKLIINNNEGSHCECTA